MKTLKRTLAFILVMTMVLSLGEGMAFASEADDPAEASQPEQTDAVLPASEGGEQAVPPAEEQTVPPAEEETTPPTEEEAAPPTEEQTTPPAEEQTTPPAEEETEPPIEEEAAPPTEGTEQPPAHATASPEPSVEPTASPEPSAEPSASPEPSVEPSASPEPSPEPEHKDWPWTEPGNTISSLMGGGTILATDSGTYISDGGLYLDETLLASVYASNLNLSDGWLYFSDGNLICRIPAGGGTVETVYDARSDVAQMYVMGQEIRYLAGGCLYSYDMTDGAVEQLEAVDGLVKFIPTPYGNLFFTGAVFNYTLWAGQTQLYSGITQCYTEGDWLIAVVGGETMQAALAPMFEGSFSLQSYSLHQDKLAGNGLSEEQQIANEQAYLESAEYAALQSGLEEYQNNGIATISTSQFLTAPLSANQQNIVMRAQQMSEVQWKCKVDRYAWGGDNASYVTSNSSKPVYKDGGMFKAGVTYKGVPYSWAVSTGYVGWDISLSDFLAAIQDANSIFYKDYSYNTRTAPYYGSDCSGFASYAWDLPYRCTCTSMLNFSEFISGSDLSVLQIGDVLNNPSSHVMLVTDIAYNADGGVVSVEITEQTPPKMRVTCYGEKISGKEYDYTGQLSFLSSYYLNGGYDIYRRSCSSRPSVSRPEDVVGSNLIDAPTMEVAPAGPNQASVTLKHATSGALIYYTTDNSNPTIESAPYVKPFTVSGSKVTIRAMVQVDGKNSFPMNEELVASQAPTLAVAGDLNSNGVFQYDSKYYVDNDVTNLTILADASATVYYTTDGSEPTVNSTHGAAGSITIPIADNMTIKAFTWVPGGIPSNAITFDIEKGVMHKITIKDSFGLIAPSTGIIDEGEIMVLNGASVTLKILKSTDTGVELDHIMVDGEDKGAPDQYTFETITANHTIEAVLKSTFSDVCSSWYVGSVAYCKAKNLFTGTSATKFSPNGDITRAMFITVLGRFAQPSIPLYGSSVSGKSWESVNYQLGVTRGEDINVRTGAGTDKSQVKDANGNVVQLGASGQYLKVFGTTYVSGVPWYNVQYNNAGSTGYVSGYYSSKLIVDACGFTDLQGDSNKSVTYAYGYAQWAYLNGIINGKSSTAFGAKSAISREDICVMLYNYLVNYYGRSVDTAARKTFADSDSISSYAKNAVNAMVNIGILQGDTANKIQPKAAATRAQVATMFMRLDQYMNG